jgi:hypothetical protein
MTPEKVIVALLEADAGVVALVGSRIFPSATTQGQALPAIFYDVIADVPQPTLSASAGENVYVARVQLACVGATYTASRELGSAVRDACHLKHGVYAGAKVVSSVLALRGPDFANDAQGVFVNQMDFSITYQE